MVMSRSFLVTRLDMLGVCRLILYVPSDVLGVGVGGIFSGLLKSQRVMGSREAKIIGYMHMYKRNHMEGQDSGIKTILSLHVVSS